MNLKQLMMLKAASGGGSSGIKYAYSLSAFVSGSGSGSAKHVAYSSGQTAYAGCYGTKPTTYTLRNASGDGQTYYPILLNGATRLYFDVLSGMKVTVFFVDSTTKADTYDAAKFISGDANAYDSSVPNGPRVVDVPEGADAYAFSIYYKSTVITDEMMDNISVRGE